MGKMLFAGKIKGMKNGNVKLGLYGSCSEISFFISFRKTTPRSCVNLWLGALKKNSKRGHAVLCGAHWLPSAPKKTRSELRDRSESFWNMELKITLIFDDITHGDKNHFQKLDIFFKPKVGCSPCGESGLFTRIPFFFYIDESHPNNWLEKLTLKTVPEAWSLLQVVRAKTSFLVYCCEAVMLKAHCWRLFSGRGRGQCWRILGRRD